MKDNGATVLAVYRRRNARHVAALLDGIPDEWSVGLWALDSVPARLASRTLGSGPGTKYELVNRLYELMAPPETADVVVSDDDVSFQDGGSLARFLDVMRQAGLSLAQPGHTAGSRYSFSITRAVPNCRARLTTFVEIGPLFAVQAAARSAFLPFPNGIGMGWGLELVWHDLSTLGYRLGVIDEVPVRHRGRVAAAYDDGPERQRLNQLFAARGLAGWEPLQQTLDTWDPSQQRAPWLEAEDSSASGT